MSTNGPQTAAEKQEYLKKYANLLWNVGTILEDREEIEDRDAIWHFLYENIDGLYEQVGRLIDSVQNELLGEGEAEEVDEGYFPFSKLGPFKEIVITYHGSGDEGWIEEINPQPPVEAFEISHELYQELEMGAYNLLEDKYAGWEINEGSHGDITIVVADRKVYLHHGQIVESTEWENTVIS